ncbi:Ldh family oxidoreductase [Nisaea acidiphila]|uniref:Ldh family oxidoreductase n=1 Tax=Nisaea acidiphila TaxID=1862145 RepID=A0A9J7AXF4_9PROT|nr:Ldh family oxidoreductase [Nisaea acidiphila]UUX51113.1 Ldh family oxidoreductase [Nisaea acidiphila]
MDKKYDAKALAAFATGLFEAAGLDEAKAGTIGPLLVEADLMGHTTHGLQLCAPYLKALDDGTMEKEGGPQVLSDRGAVVTWDGRRLPGVWLTARAVDLGVERAKLYGTASIAIRRSHHIACLAVFLERATRAGCMVQIASSDPAVSSVAPYGGTEPLFTPDPIAVGIPTGGDPILIDTSASITTNGLTGRLHGEGKKLPGAWVQNAEGAASDDPAVLFTDPPGTILPIGGKEYGHKGYGLALMIEALTQGLPGHGRADPAEGWGAGVYVQVMDPTAFTGEAAFTRQIDHIVERCRANKPVAGGPPVRLPGQSAIAKRAASSSGGVALYPGIIDALAPWAEKYGLVPPVPISAS